MGHSAAISAVAGIAITSDNCNPNDPLMYLASSDSANTIKIWKCGADSITCTQTLSIHPHHSTALAFSYLPNTFIPVLFSGGSDLKITLYSKHGESVFLYLHSLQNCSLKNKLLFMAILIGSELLK